MWGWFSPASKSNSVKTTNESFFFLPVCNEMIPPWLDIYHILNVNVYVHWRSALVFLPGSIAGVCEGHGADSQLVKHPQCWKTAVNRVASFNAYQTGYFIPVVCVINICKDTHTFRMTVLIFRVIKSSVPWTEVTNSKSWFSVHMRRITSSCSRVSLTASFCWAPHTTKAANIWQRDRNVKRDNATCVLVTEVKVMLWFGLFTTCTVQLIQAFKGHSVEQSMYQWFPTWGARWGARDHGGWGVS